MYGDAESYRFFSKETGKFLGERVCVLNIALSNHDGELNIVDTIDLLWDENEPLPDSVLNPFNGSKEPISFIRLPRLSAWSLL